MVLDGAGRRWTVLDGAGRCWTVLDGVGQCWMVLDGVGWWYALLFTLGTQNCPYSYHLPVCVASHANILRQKPAT